MRVLALHIEVTMFYWSMTQYVLCVALHGMTVGAQCFSQALHMKGIYASIAQYVLFVVASLWHHRIASMFYWSMTQYVLCVALHGVTVGGTMHFLRHCTWKAFTQALLSMFFL